MHGGYRESRGLFEPCLHEQHPLCELAEFCGGAAPEPSLRQPRGDERRGVPGRPQFAHHAHDIFGGVIGGQPVKEPQPFRREQCDEFVLIHRPILVPNEGNDG